MLSRLVPFFKPRGQPRESRFKHHLVRNALGILLLTSLIPLLLIGTLNYFRSHDMLREQVNSQLQNITDHQVRQTNEYVKMHTQGIDRLVTASDFKNALNALLSNPQVSPERQQADAQISSLFRDKPHTIATDFFDNFMIVMPNATIVMTTNKDWAKGFGVGKVNNPNLMGLIGTNRSTFIYSPSASYMNKLALVTARSFVDENGKQRATLIAISTSETTQRLLADSSSFLPEAYSYYFSREGDVIGLGLEGWLKKMPVNLELYQRLTPLLGDQRTGTLFTATAYQNTPVFAAAQWIPEYNLGIALMVSQEAVLQQSILFGPINIAVLALALFISGSMIFFSTTHLVKPLVQLADVTEQFAKGNLEERASIYRNDEIGLLANTFNNMAGELTRQHDSIDKIVELRTRQLRIASEVAQQATATNRLSDTLGQTVALIADRFSFYHVAIYLLDQTSQTLILREASGFAGDLIKQQGDQAKYNSENLLGWVASQNQPRIISEVTDDPLFRPNTLLPDTRSEMAIPVVTGNEILGVLDIQSSLQNAFNQETLSIFQSLANQISGTLQNTRLLEMTQASYQETARLYRATRLVTQAQNETEIIQILVDTFTQLPLIGSILSVDGENFRILAVTDPKSGKVETNLVSLNIPTGQIAGLLVENRTVLIDDISQPSPYDNLLSFLIRRGCKSAALVSVLENGRLSKVLVLGAPEINQITYNSLQPYANLAEVISASIEKFHVLSTLQQRLSELQILANVGQAITAETELSHLYRVLHEQVMQTLGSDIEFGIAIYNASTNEIQFPYFFETNQLISIPPYPLGEGLTSTLIQSHKPLLLTNDREVRESPCKLVRMTPRSWMGVPLIFANEVLGALIVQDLHNENRFNTDDLNLFMALAPQIATTVRNAQLYNETQQALSAYSQERFLLSTLLDNMPEGISFKDPSGRYIRASHSIATIFNINAEALIGKTDFDLLDHEYAEAISRAEQTVMESGKPQIGLIEPMLSKSGIESWTNTSRIPVQTTSGDPYGLLVIQHDITDLKQAEALAQRRAGQILTAAEIARDTTGTLDVKTLLQKSVNLVRERFGFYHASIFLLDAANEYAILRESTGLAGQKMVEDCHRLAVGSKSIVGQVTASGQPLIVNDVTVDPTYLPNPLLPDTRGELAIPLKIGKRVLGALDVQSSQASAFNQEDVSVLTILADQLAVAVVNGELFAKTHELLGKHRLLRQITISANASTSLEDTLGNVVSSLRSAQLGERVAALMLNDQGVPQVRASAGYESAPDLNARLALGQGITRQAAIEKRPIRVDDTLGDARYIDVDPKVRSELAIPILFGDELIGVLNLESSRVSAFDENDQEILGALGNNLGGVIANIHLVNQIRQQVTRERQLFDVTSKIRRSVDLETILQTSTREIARALGARRASIEITAGKAVLLDASSPDYNSGSIGVDNGSDGKSTNNGHNYGREA